MSLTDVLIIYRNLKFAKNFNQKVIFKLIKFK